MEVINNLFREESDFFFLFEIIVFVTNMHLFINS
jgi:hypothetical protein